MGFRKLLEGFRRKKIKKAVVFPGQGSQFLGMAADIPAEILNDLRSQTEQALGEDLTSFLFYLISKDAADVQGEEKQKFQKRLSQNAQLTTFITSWGMYLRDKHAIGVPDYVSGHSLGLYTALCAADVATFSELIKIIKFRQSSMNDASLLFDGGMMAVKGDVRKIKERFFRKTKVKIANLNTPSQGIITGLKNELSIVEPRLKSKGFKVIPLKVAGPYHHPEYMSLASRTLDYILSLPDTAIRSPKIPLILDTTGIEEGDPHRIRRALVNQVVDRVRWADVIGFFIRQNIPKEYIIEKGPNGVLTKMLDDFPGLKSVDEEKKE